MSILITFKAFPDSYHPAWKFSNYYVLKFCLGFESFSNQGIYHTVNRLRSSVSSCHPVSYRVNLCHPMPPFHPVSFRVIPCQSHVIKFHLVSSSVIPGQLVSSHVIKFHLVSSRVISTISSTWPQMNGWTDERIIIIIIQLCISLRWPHGWYGLWLVVWRQQFRIPRDLSSETDWWNLIIIYDAINSFFLVIQQSKFKNCCVLLSTMFTNVCDFIPTVQKFRKVEEIVSETFTHCFHKFLNNEKNFFGKSHSIHTNLYNTSTLHPPTIL